MRTAQIGSFFQVAFVGYLHTRFALNGFYQKAAHIFILKSRFQSGGIVVGNTHKTGRKRTKTAVAVGVLRKRYNGGGAPVKITVTHYYHGFVRLNTLDGIPPAAAEFEGSFYGFGTGVHRQHFVVAEKFGDVFFVFAERIVVKSAGSEREFLSLLYQCSYNFGVAMTLIDGRICRKEIVIAAVFTIPHIHALAARKHNGNRVIIMCAVFIFKFYEVVGSKRCWHIVKKYFVTKLSFFFIKIHKQSVKR